MINSTILIKKEERISFLIFSLKKKKMSQIWTCSIFLWLISFNATDCFGIVRQKSPLDCDFESKVRSSCNWKLHPKFSINQPLRNSIIYFDHTTASQQGHYVSLGRLHVEERGTMVADNPFQQNDQICFSFYYFIHSRGFSQIELTIKKYKRETVLYRAYDSIELKWHHALIDFTFNDTYEYFQFGAGVVDGRIVQKKKYFEIKNVLIHFL